MDQLRASTPRVQLTKWHFAGIAIAAIALLLLFAFNPAQHGFYPRCMFKKFTSLDCPGCGGLRATHQLLHGNIKAAFAFNPLAVGALPFLLLVGLNSLIARVRGRPLVNCTFSPSMIVIIAIIVVLFTIVRNMGSFS